MKTRIASVIALIALGVVAAAMASDSPATPATDYLIKVSSGTPGTEVPVNVASLIRNADAPFESGTRRTPFEMRATGSAAAAILRSTGDGSILVEVTGTRAGKQVFRSTATGRAVVVGDNMPGRQESFISSF